MLTDKCPHCFSLLTDKEYTNDVILNCTSCEIDYKQTNIDLYHKDQYAFSFTMKNFHIYSDFKIIKLTILDWDQKIDSIDYFEIDFGKLDELNDRFKSLLILI